MNLILVSLLFSFTFIYGEDDNPCLSATDCKNCLNLGGVCYWCEDVDFTATIKRPRCNYKPLLVADEGCKKITMKDGSVLSKTVVKFSSTIQVSPEVVNLELRPDQTKTFTLSVKPAKDFPVHLYYLMDMSKSMDDDLENLKSLGTKIANELKGITANYKLAFGTFVDKTVSPFIQIEKKDEPCQLGGGVACQATFGYRHVFDFSDDATKFEEAVKKQKISGNLDTPEGGFDAFMQVAVCDKELGWVDTKFARRIVVFVTDASPHIAGDGKLGGIVVPNDGKCHLAVDPSSAGKMSYTKTNDMDYPSVSELKAKLKENKIVPILAVTSDVFNVYKKLTDEWKDIGAAIGALKSDSGNIVELIREKYRAISTTVRLTDDSPKSINVKYKVTSSCKNKKDDNECSNVGIDEQVDFDVSVTAITCPPDPSKDRSFKINIPGFGEVVVNVKMICECPCEKAGQGVVNSDKCSKTGTYQCGICYCNKDRFGNNCECDKEAQADTSRCKVTNTTDEKICSGFGSCICGKCECDKRKREKEIISGTHCQCNNFGCDRYQGLVCGGIERGVCECGKCKCKEAFLGDNCGKKNCTLGRRNCVKDGVVCSSNGECDCDECVCSTGYKGKYCENCVSCPGKCSNHKDCVLCQVFKKGPADVCSKCNLNIKIVNKTEEKCAFKDDDDCFVVFSFENVNELGLNETVVVQKEKRCIVVIKKDPPILAIVLGTIGGIVLLGLILLLLWKLLVTAYDNYEYHKFEKDRMKSKWENAENPIYRPSKQQFQNPAYAGNK